MSREMACVYYDNMKCKKFEEPGYVSWCVMGPCSHQQPSKGDRFRAMSDEELATVFSEMCKGMEMCKGCIAYHNCPGESVGGWENWLKQPAEVE